MAERPVITVEHHDTVAVVWLDRPQARNAMGPAFWDELPAAFGALAADRSTRVVVVAAKGPAFSVGLDLKAMAGVLAGGGGGDEGGGADGQASSAPSMAARAGVTRAGVKRLQASINAVADCPLPVIAAVHGYCIGGGVDLITACDIRVASADTVLSVRETRMAIVADLGSLQRLPRVIAPGHVAELAFTGKDIDAAHAERIGLVNAVFPDAETTLKGALAMAGEIAANSPLVVQGTKAVLRAGEGRSVAEGLDYVATWNAGFLKSDDLVEAMTAFMTKRPPEFHGR